MFGGASASSPARAAATSVRRLPRQLLILVPTQIIEVRGQKNKKA